MTNSNESKAKRGRPPSGKKAYCIRMTPETHDLLLKMAAEQCTDLKTFLEVITLTWKDKQEFARSDNPTDDRTALLFGVLFVEATEALKHLRSRVERCPALMRRRSIKGDWGRLRQEYERLAKAVAIRRS